LLGYRSLHLQPVFRNVQDLLTVRRDITPIALANAKKRTGAEAYAEVMRDQATTSYGGASIQLDDAEDEDTNMCDPSSSTAKGPTKSPLEFIISS
jgi:DNA polymerase epsilon subunit 1